jgi:hypothetical protein
MTDPNLELFRRFGWGALSPRHWAAAAERQRERLQAAHEALLSDAGGIDEQDVLVRQMHVDTHFLLIAARHIQRALDRYRELLDDPRVERIWLDFVVAFPEAKRLRDVLEHLDEYALGAGRLHRSGELPQAHTFPKLPIDHDPIGEIYVVLGEWSR